MLMQLRFCRFSSPGRFCTKKQGVIKMSGFNSENKKTKTVVENKVMDIPKSK